MRPLPWKAGKQSSVIRSPPGKGMGTDGCKSWKSHLELLMNIWHALEGQSQNRPTSSSKPQNVKTQDLYWSTPSFNQWVSVNQSLWATRCLDTRNTAAHKTNPNPAFWQVYLLREDAGQPWAWMRAGFKCVREGFLEKTHMSATLLVAMTNATQERVIVLVSAST